MKLYLDIGGTHIRYIFKENGRRAVNIVDTGKTPVMPFLEQLIKRSEKTPDFVGISFAGQVHNGCILSAPNIDVEPIDLQAFLRTKYGIRSVVENDLKCAALYEYNRRRTASMLVVIAIGTGLGSAYIYNGKLIRGCGNLAGEVGHIPFKKAPFRCGCGQNSCLELFTSGSGIARWIKYLNIDSKPILDDLMHSTDKNAKMVTDNFYEGLSSAVRTAAAMLNPDVIVMGGGLMESNPDLLSFVRNEIKTRSFRPAAKFIKVEAALDNASLMGAQLLG